MSHTDPQGLLAWDNSMKDMTYSVHSRFSHNKYSNWLLTTLKNYICFQNYCCRYCCLALYLTALCQLCTSLHICTVSVCASIYMWRLKTSVSYFTRLLYDFHWVNEFMEPQGRATGLKPVQIWNEIKGMEIISQKHQATRIANREPNAF